MFANYFDVFSRRKKNLTSLDAKPLTKEFRTRFFMMLRDEPSLSFPDFLDELHKKVSYFYGRVPLSSKGSYGRTIDDIIEFLMECKDESFFDVIELMFRSNLRGITWPDNRLIESINQFFIFDDLPYYLTGFVTQEVESNYMGSKAMCLKISEYPQIICKGSEIVHELAMQPTLLLLQAKEYENANDEFLKALEDHRKGDFRDCLTKCGSAFESVMKILCKENNIAYQERDTASALLKLLLSSKNNQLDTYWEQPLILIATLRNKLSSSHGAGPQPKLIPRHVATYAGRIQI